MDDIVADEFLRRLPIALCHGCGERLLVHFTSSQANVFAMMRIAKNVGEKHLVSVKSFFWILRNRRRNETRHVPIRQSLPRLLCALFDLADTLCDIARCAAG